MKPIHMIRCFIAFALFNLSLAGPALAVPMLETDMGGKVIGVSDLEVGGMTFDVAFLAGSESFNDALAALGDPFDFGSLADATAAGSTLDSFFNSIPTTASEMSWGPMDDTMSQFYDIPFNIFPVAGPQRLISEWDVAGQQWDFFTSTANLAPVLSIGTTHAWAFFSEATVLPEPSSALLITVGLFGLVALRRRRA